MYGWRARIGVVIPCGNTTLEPEFCKLSAGINGVSVHFTRMHLREEERTTKEALLEMESLAVETVVSELVHASVDVIVYGCTSGSFVGGLGWDQEILGRIGTKTDIPATTATTAVVTALKALGVKKVALGTPYDTEITELGKVFLEGEGFEVVSVVALDNVDSLADEPIGLAYKLGRKVDTQYADCVFISCTHFPTIETVDIMERDLGKPVISANLASFWHALQLLGIEASLLGYGCLLEGKSGKE